MLMVLVGIVIVCFILYKFNGLFIDYIKVKIILFENFLNCLVGFVWGLMENMFNMVL